MDKEALKMWRARHELTQSQAAEVFGRLRRCYQKWESGDAPVPQYAATIAGHYNKGKKVKK